MSYGAGFPDQFRRAVDFVDKILRGAKPGEIPVEQPTKFDLIINLTTAKASGSTRRRGDRVSHCHSCSLLRRMSPQLRRFSECAGRPARSRGCKSLTVKE
jgi:ABC-type uncharacterized transport system substrate-binding protein